MDEDATDKHVPVGLPLFITEMRNARVLGIDMDCEEKASLQLFGFCCLSFTLNSPARTHARTHHILIL